MPAVSISIEAPFRLQQSRRMLCLAADDVLVEQMRVKVLVDYALRGDALPRSNSHTAGTAALPDVTLTLILFAAAMSVGLFVINSALSVGLSIAWSMAGQHMVYDLAGDVFARLQRLSMCFHSRRSVGDSLSRMMEDSWCIYSLADGLLDGAGSTSSSRSS